MHPSRVYITGMDAPTCEDGELLTLLHETPLWLRPCLGVLNCVKKSA